MPALSPVPDSNQEARAAGYVFRLYVAGEAPNSRLALRNLKVLCQDHYRDDFHIDVVDVLLSPERAWTEGVIVTPTVVRIIPEPGIRIIGNLSNTDQVLSVLGFAIQAND
jgi:circadian clock protein KaiB